MERFNRQCVIVVLIGLALLMLGDIPPDTLSLGGFAVRLITFKTLGVLIFSLAVQANKKWRVYGNEE